MTSAPQLPDSLEAAHAAKTSAQGVITTLSEKLSQTVRENELLRQKIDKLCRRLFGKSSEKVSPDQLALAFAQLPQDEAAETESLPAASAEAAEEAASETSRRRPSPTGRKAFPKHLLRKRVVVMPPAEDLTCGCGQAKTQIAEKVTERLDYVPASAVVVETVRPVFVCEKCHDGVTVAPTPTQAVEGSAAGSGLLAYIIVSKYVDHLPLHRLERIFARQGVELSRSTMCGQLALAEEALAPLGEEIVTRLRAGPYLQFDYTSVLVQAEADKARFYGKMWTYHSPLEGPVGFDATETREHEGPLRFLAGFEGYLQGDAYSGNLTLRKKSPVFLVGCMAHLRRYFVVALEKDPRAAHFIAVIKQLYKIEEEARYLGYDERRALRQRRATPPLRELMRLARAMERSVLPKSPLGEALTYLAGLLFLAGPSATLAADRAPSPKRFDLVLLHGLTNKQRWGDEFLTVCAKTWGPGRVFLVYTNRRASDRVVTATRHVRGHALVAGGRDLTSAGDESVARQAEHVHEIVARLQARRGLGPRFSIIAHSMGGLVARRYIADHPGVVTGLVILGTPHLGSPLANEAKWVGFFAHATDAIADLQPERCAAFNTRFPASAARLAEGGRIYTIRGGSEGPGAMGELAIGWTLLHAVHGVDSDGLVPNASALLEGALHIADFPAVDHHALIRDPVVARRATDVLP